MNDLVYRRYLLAMIEKDQQTQQELHDAMMAEPYDVPEEESVTKAIGAAQDEYVRRYMPNLRKNLGSLAIQGEKQMSLAVQLDKIFFGFPPEPDDQAQ